MASSITLDFQIDRMSDDGQLQAKMIDAADFSETPFIGATDFGYLTVPADGVAVAIPAANGGIGYFVYGIVLKNFSRTTGVTVDYGGASEYYLPPGGVFVIANQHDEGGSLGDPTLTNDGTDPAKVSYITWRSALT